MSIHVYVQCIRQCIIIMYQSLHEGYISSKLWYILKYLSSVWLPRQVAERGGQSDIVTFSEQRESLDTLLRWCVYTELLNLYCIVDLK